MAASLLDKLIPAYIYSTLAFLLLRLFVKGARDRTPRYLGLANGILLIPVFLVAIGLVSIVVSCKTCYGTAFYFPIVCRFLLGCVFPLTFLFRKNREKVSMTIVSIVLLSMSIYINFGLVFIYLTSIYRDYLPSSWATYYDRTADQVWTIGIAALYFAVCWIGAGRTSILAKK